MTKMQLRVVLDDKSQVEMIPGLLDPIQAKISAIPADCRHK
jgi:hypothetical protein